MAPNCVFKDPTAIRIPSWEFVADIFSIAIEKCWLQKNLKMIAI